MNNLSQEKNSAPSKKSLKKAQKEDLEEVSIDEIVDHFKANPKLKGFSNEQLKTFAEVCILEKREEYFESSFVGPLPPPSYLEGYERTLKGAANRILGMAEYSAKKRIETNIKIVDHDIKRANRGLILGFALSIVFIGAAILCAYFKQPFPAIVLGIGGFSSIVSLFVTGRK